MEIYEKICIKEALKLSLNALKLIKYKKMNYINCKQLYYFFNLGVEN
ncbi:hypothetical protein VAMP_125n9 [Candidatus Vampirococcus lugosii]|uniref:Uncharacterized protein n=1 Tax=Candidatus Vampirococcus lugosii TaxID=2789015 RepID=A0ABS5QP55_9BACT|nr:hypothetical protein [Candidatus Vampirococcus lugosii]